MPIIYDKKVLAHVDNDTIKTLTQNALVPVAYDSIEFGYSGTELSTVTFKLAGSTVATLTLTYDGDNLKTVTKT